LSYLVKEIFYSLQGEGYYSGRPAVFCRFTGCNLWSGKEADRQKAVCKICDTDFLGTDGKEGGIYKTPTQLANKAIELWPQRKKSIKPFIVCTGGEPLLQMDKDLIVSFHEQSFEIAVETNGTIAAPPGIDWLCVSPKAGAKLVQDFGHELKFVYPQPKAEPEKYGRLDFQHFFLQPLDGLELKENVRKTLEYVLLHPQWRLSLQLHKIMAIK
jgi:7-carboxy-7-deazaguanine synthase